MSINTMFRFFGSVLREDAEKEIINLDRDSWSKLLKLSKKHDLAHLIGYAIKDSGNKIDEDIQKAFEQEMNMAMFRYFKISYDLEAITNALEKAQIGFIPLKGSVIRKYYKEPWMRTSCDIDILVDDCDLERAKKVLVEELNYTYASEWNYEVSFYTPSKTHIELHRTLKDENQAIDKVLSTVWERSSPIPNCSFYYEMSDEMYYFYHIAHMAKHFVNGGCGIRPFIDIWVINHNCEFDKQKRYALLDEAGLLQFAKAAEQLSEVWIGGELHTPLSEQLEQFVLSGGTYGTVENRVALAHGKKGGRIRYVLSRVFAPYSKLKRYYPVLEKHKWLMPVMQVRRWFMLLRPRIAKMARKEMVANGNIDKKSSEKMSELLNHIGLD